MKVTGILILVVTLISTITTNIAGYNQGGTWSSPIQLSMADQSAWFPAIETDAYGTIHVVWSQNIAPNDTVMYTSSQDGLNWSPLNDIVAIPTDRGSEATRPDLLYNPRSETLNLSYHSYDIFTAEASVRDAQNSSAWNTYAIVNDRSQNSYYSRSGIDSFCTQHMLVTWNVPTPACQICYHVFYRKRYFGENTWTNPVDISSPETGSAKPFLLVDEEDHLHAIWESSDIGGGSYGTVERPSNINYSKSEDGGENWSEPIVISASVEEAKNPAISTDMNGQLVAVWLGLPEDVIYYQLSTDGGDTWLDPTPLTGMVGGFTNYNSLLDTYSTSKDSDGNIHLAAIGRTNNRDRQLHLFHVTWNGISWSEPDNVVTYTAAVPEWPQIAISNGNRVHVVWFLRDDEHIWDTENGKYSIWYAQLLTTATYTPPKPIPTNTPEQVIAQTADVKPTQTVVVPTQSATAPFLYTPDNNITYKETQYIKIMAIALLPTLVFIILVFIFIFRRRR
ncbi:MAG TPA: exo-alpha-sialidase [Anaerolineaceae bacterium]|nr:exo-alpha-sialidase [Anaerolineaceae bacterium]HOU45137.1 exo-alpha-sialidase [Anaerolineaceae bacterium]HPA34347.1 exo-alpha-sialidase [Anaerolineaceae bacterium]HQF46742.1 exo-alpha-sialidase [Anaerolineaceae bacterium]HQH36532.1 exo-alpha-sialidase [Anaerolineaceae bacterium]